MPASTPWPMVMALGIALIPAGLVLGPHLGKEGTAFGLVSPVSFLGLILFFLALYKMIRQDIDEAAGGH
jgi:hypothetical protein